MPEWVLLGCDSDINGALAVIRGPLVGFVHSIEVHDCRMKEVSLNNTARSRQDVDAMARLVAGLNISAGTVCEAFSAYNGRTLRNVRPSASCPI